MREICNLLTAVALNQWTIRAIPGESSKVFMRPRKKAPVDALTPTSKSQDMGFGGTFRRIHQNIHEAKAMKESATLDRTPASMISSHRYWWFLMGYDREWMLSYASAAGMIWQIFFEQLHDSHYGIWSIGFDSQDPSSQLLPLSELASNSTCLAEENGLNKCGSTG